MKTRHAFTLIEVLIVVIIMAILAATIIPQFSSSATDAKKAGLDFDTHFIRSQIELYKGEHNGAVPAFARFVDQMTKVTDIKGNTTGSSTALIYGPYIQGSFPTNQLADSGAVVRVATAGTAPTAVVPGGAGWQYDETTGGFYPNNKEAY